MDKVHRLTLTVRSDLQHRPIQIRIAVPEELSLALQSMPITSIDIMAEAAPGFTNDKIKLLDYTPNLYISPRN